MISPKFPTAFRQLEDRINLLYTYGVKAGEIDLHTFVERRQHAGREDCSACSRARARSSPAAMPTSSSSIRITAARSPPRRSTMNVDYSAFEGWKLEGRPSVVTVRGEVQVRDGKFVGKLGRGQFLKRTAESFLISAFLRRPRRQHHAKSQITVR